MIIKILIDTNFLILPLKTGKNFKIQLDNLIGFNYELLVLTDSINELAYVEPRLFENIKANNSLIETLWPGIKIVNAESTLINNVDDRIVEYAVKNNCAVATNDASLRSRLRKNNVTTIYLRHKSHLAIDGNIG
ncbi:MAG: hypothetical protein QW327_03950 [Candidatus Odinarchaeota archaeon]